MSIGTRILLQSAISRKRIQVALVIMAIYVASSTMTRETHAGNARQRRSFIS